MTVFFERFTALCDSIGKAPNAVAKELGIPSGSITAWAGKTVPRLVTIKKLAAYFGVPTSYLTGDTDEKSPPTLNEQGEGGKMADFDKLFPSEKRVILDMIQAFIASHGEGDSPEKT